MNVTIGGVSARLASNSGVTEHNQSIAAIAETDRAALALSRVDGGEGRAQGVLGRISAGLATGCRVVGELVSSLLGSGQAYRDALMARALEQRAQLESVMKQIQGQAATASCVVRGSLEVLSQWHVVEQAESLDEYLSSATVAQLKTFIRQATEHTDDLLRTAERLTEGGEPGEVLRDWASRRPRDTVLLKALDQLAQLDLRRASIRGMVGTAPEAARDGLELLSKWPLGIRPQLLEWFLSEGRAAEIGVVIEHVADQRVGLLRMAEELIRGETTSDRVLEVWVHRQLEAYYLSGHGRNISAASLTTPPSYIQAVSPIQATNPFAIEARVAPERLLADWSLQSLRPMVLARAVEQLELLDLCRVRIQRMAETAPEATRNGLALLSQWPLLKQPQELENILSSGSVRELVSLRENAAWHRNDLLDLSRQLIQGEITSGDVQRLWEERGLPFLRVGERERNIGSWSSTALPTYNQATSLPSYDEVTEHSRL